MRWIFNQVIHSAHAARLPAAAAALLALLSGPAGCGKAEDPPLAVEPRDPPPGGQGEAGAAVPTLPQPAGTPPGVPGLALPALPGPMGDRLWMLERQREEIAASDADGDGKLSADEYLKRYIERHRRRFELLDADRDGKLTAEEMADATDPQKMMERVQQPPENAESR